MGNFTFLMLPIYDTYLRPLFDIAALAMLLYWCYQLVMKTNALSMLRLISVVLFGYAFIVCLRLATLKWLFDKVAFAFVICAAIVFQPELRKIFLRIGLGMFKMGRRAKQSNIDSVLIAAETLSKERRGMLVVFPRNDGLNDICETGTTIQAEISSALLITIFEFDTPLHDGAVIVQNGKIVAAGCFLPLSNNSDLKKTFGTRHRAALGMSEQSDAVVLVVSEERGSMSLACEGEFIYDLSVEQLGEYLSELLTPSAVQKIDGEKDDGKKQSRA